VYNLAKHHALTITDVWGKEMSNYDIEPGFGAFAVTPADSVDLERVTRALHVGESGTLKVVMASGETVTLTGAQGILPIRVRQVFSTGTTATGITGLY
jgi:hypothetical protein